MRNGECKIERQEHETKDSTYAQKKNPKSLRNVNAWRQPAASSGGGGSGKMNGIW